MRKLATIRKVGSILPIENADAIESLRIDGWNVVSRKGVHKVGDKVVYFEIDSILPRKPWNDFLFKGSDSEKTEIRLRSVKLRGTLSQGLVVPLADIFPDNSPDDFEVSQDLTEELGIQKYDPPIPAQLAGKIEGPFPRFIPKTDEERIQNCEEILKELSGKPYYISYKLDGSSGTFYKKDSELGVCGRNWKLKQEEANTFWKLAAKYELNGLPEGYAVQGECVGEGIQKNRMGIRGHDLFIFNVFNIGEGKYLDCKDMLDFCAEYKLQSVPILDFGNSFNYNLDSLFALCESKKYRDAGFNSDFPIEGIVIRPWNEAYSEVLNGRFSFKVINNKFLLKNGE